MLTIDITDSLTNPTILIKFSVIVDGKMTEDSLNFCTVTGMKRKLSVTDQEPIFYYLNHYWSLLPLSSQKDIFEIYKTIHDVIDYTHNKDQLNIQLKQHVAALMKHHSLKAVGEYVQYRSNIEMPALVDEFVQDVNSIHTRDLTYTLPDYKALLVFALAVRSLTPIWNEYVVKIKEHTGDQFKELYAFYLLEHTEHFACPAINKLMLYIDRVTSASAEANIFHMKSVSAEDYVELLLAQTIVKKLCMAQLSTTDVRYHMVSFCYHFLLPKTQPRATSPEKTVRSKKASGNTSDDQKPSFAENYHITTELSAGQLAELEYCVSDVNALADKLAPSMSKEFLNNCVMHAYELLSFSINDPQIRLMQWILKPVIPPKGILYVPEPTRIKMLGLTQAVLYHRGHKYLSLLTTSRPVEVGGMPVVSDRDSRIGFTQENIDNLIKYYPFKTPNWEKQKDIKQQYAIFKTIEIMVDGISRFNWRTTADDKMCLEVLGKSSKLVPVVGDIRNELARLIIQLGTRDYPV